MLIRLLLFLLFMLYTYSTPSPNTYLEKVRRECGFYSKSTLVRSGSHTMKLHSLETSHSDAGKPVVVFLHGIYASSIMFSFYMNELSDKYHVIALDIPGWGFSEDVSSDSLDGEEYCVFLNDIVNGFLNARRIQKCHLVGQSLGGYFAFRYAESYPSRLSSLVMVNPFGLMPHRILYHPLAYYAIPHYLIRSIYPFISLWTRIRGPSVYTLALTHMALQSKNRFLIQKFLTPFDVKTPWISSLRNLQVPTSIIVGKRDKYVPIAPALQSVKQNNERIRIYLSEKGGHAMFNIPHMARILRQALDRHAITNREKK